MGKVINKYENKLDKCWFDSTNILYAECDDNVDELKTVRVTFKNGATYQYSDVNVFDWLKFREYHSAGKAFLTYIKKYECERLENKNVEDIQKELNDYLEEIKDKEKEIVNGDREDNESSN